MISSTAAQPVKELPGALPPARAAATRWRLDADAGELDELIANGDIPPTIAIMPDAPWSSRASYYVDSAYRGADPGRPVETAFTQDLIAHVDSTYRTVAARNGRGVAGYSMGGYGAIRYSLAHPDLFGASIVLSPAVYFPFRRATRARASSAPSARTSACSSSHLQEAELSGDASSRSRRQG